MRRIRSVFAKYLSQPALEIDGVALQLAADAHSSKTSAARAVAYLQPVIKWAAKRGLIKNVFDLEKPTVGDDESDGLGQRVLSAKELLILLPHFYGSSRGRCCEFLLITGARLREATEATWDEIDCERAIWTISAGRRKDTRSRTRRKQVPTLPHVVPLSRQALKILDEARAEEKSRRERLGLATTISPTDPVFVGERGGILQNWDRWLKLVALTTGFTGWSAHALRRTAATMAANLGGEPHVISVLLGHKNIGGQLTAGYNKSRYLREHTEILQKLGDHVDSIRGGFTNLVIPLRSA